MLASSTLSFFSYEDEDVEEKEGIFDSQNETCLIAVELSNLPVATLLSLDKDDPWITLPTMLASSTLSFFSYEEEEGEEKEGFFDSQNETIFIAVDLSNLPVATLLSLDKDDPWITLPDDIPEPRLFWVIVSINHPSTPADSAAPLSVPLLEE